MTWLSSARSVTPLPPYWFANFQLLFLISILFYFLQFPDFAGMWGKVFTYFFFTQATNLCLVLNHSDHGQISIVGYY